MVSFDHLDQAIKASGGAWKFWDDLEKSPGDTLLVSAQSLNERQTIKVVVTHDMKVFIGSDKIVDPKAHPDHVYFNLTPRGQK